MNSARPRKLFLPGMKCCWHLRADVEVIAKPGRHYQKCSTLHFGEILALVSGLVLIVLGPVCPPPGNTGGWQGGEPGAHTHRAQPGQTVGLRGRAAQLSDQCEDLNTQHSTHRKLESESSECAACSER